MTDQISHKYPIFVMCGRDPRRRRLMEAVDPENKYKSKALLPFLGRRLVEWQLEELRQSPYVGDVLFIGIERNGPAINLPGALCSRPNRGRIPGETHPGAGLSGNARRFA